jgi:hypothetical protein
MCKGVGYWRTAGGVLDILLYALFVDDWNYDPSIVLNTTQENLQKLETENNEKKNLFMLKGEENRAILVINKSW